jgi:hypothetical protein
MNITHGKMIGLETIEDIEPGEEITVNYLVSYTT